MSTALFRNPKMDRACADGYIAAEGGAAESTNPFDGTGLDEELAWDIGHRLYTQDGVGAHANTTAFTAGQVISEAGEVYVAVKSGTTGTGTAPSGTARNVQEVDGTVTWEWIGTGTEIQLTAFGDDPKAGGVPLVIPETLQDGAEAA